MRCQDAESRAKVRALVFGVVTLFVGALMTQAALGQSVKGVEIGKKGEIHFKSKVKAGDTVLGPGMYQVQHVVDGDSHAIVFREMSMPAGYRMGSATVGKEVARAKCSVEPVEKKVHSSRIVLRTTDAGEKQVAEVQIAGEAYKHVLNR
jgi:hypothetical protein